MSKSFWSEGYWPTRLPNPNANRTKNANGQSVTVQLTVYATPKIRMDSSIGDWLSSFQEPSSKSPSQTLWALCIARHAVDNPAYTSWPSSKQSSSSSGLPKVETTFQRRIFSFPGTLNTYNQWLLTTGNRLITAEKRCFFRISEDSNFKQIRINTEVNTTSISDRNWCSSFKFQNDLMNFSDIVVNNTL